MSLSLKSKLTVSAVVLHQSPKPSSCPSASAAWKGPCKTLEEKKVHRPDSERSQLVFLSELVCFFKAHKLSRIVTTSMTISQIVRIKKGAVGSPCSRPSVHMGLVQ